MREFIYRTYGLGQKGFELISTKLTEKEAINEGRKLENSFYDRYMIVEHNCKDGSDKVIRRESLKGKCNLVYEDFKSNIKVVGKGFYITPREELKNNSQKIVEDEEEER